MSRYYITKEKVTECRAKRLKNGSAKFPTQANNVPRDGPPSLSKSPGLIQFYKTNFHTQQWIHNMKYY